MKDVEQNSAGNKYAIAYIDDGKFKLRVFDKEPRTEEEAVESDALEACQLSKIPTPFAPNPTSFPFATHSKLISGKPKS